jgi:peptidoglycan/xylan/chitin deacetylase (PgdA/CDA1 family)
VSHALALTFDDAYVDEWVAALPIFAKYGARATFFVAYAPKLESRDVAKLHTLLSAGHEIGYHSVTHANAVTFSQAQGVDRYIATEVIPGLDVMTLFGFKPAAFAYPFNAHTAELDEALHAHFQVLRIRAETIAEALHPPTGNKLLRAKSCDTVAGDGKSLRTVDDVETCLYEAEQTGRTLVLYGHGISDTPVRHHFMTALGLDHVLATARARGFEFRAVSELT